MLKQKIKTNKILVNSASTYFKTYVAIRAKKKSVGLLQKFMVQDIKKSIRRNDYKFKNLFKFTKSKVVLFLDKQNLFVNKQILFRSLHLPSANYKFSRDDSLKVKNLNIIQKYTFTKVLPFTDLPYIFNLAEKQLLRYSAKFFGYNYLSHMFSYTL
jgi:hypothetical protein